MMPGIRNKKRPVSKEGVLSFQLTDLRGLRLSIFYFSVWADSIISAFFAQLSLIARRAKLRQSLWRDYSINWNFLWNQPKPRRTAQYQ
jgi:hypothetical protein